jgi:hypothetical protein
MRKAREHPSGDLGVVMPPTTAAGQARGGHSNDGEISRNFVNFTIARSVRSGILLATVYRVVVEELR